MTINDLESQIVFKYEEKVAALQRLIKGYKKNLDLVMKKYESLKQATTKDKSVSDIHSNSQRRIQQGKPNVTMTDQSVENTTINHNNSLNLTNIGEDTQISEGKEEQINQLKNELSKVKQSLEGMTKKCNILQLETDESHKSNHSNQVYSHTEVCAQKIKIF